MYFWSKVFLSINKKGLTKFLILNMLEGNDIQILSSKEP